MVKKQDWQSFRNTGLVVIINQILHIFGWSIVFDIKDDKIVDVYPARVKFRGFSEDSQQRAYTKISEYMLENAYILNKEIQE